MKSTCFALLWPLPSLQLWGSPCPEQFHFCWSDPPQLPGSCYDLSLRFGLWSGGCVHWVHSQGPIRGLGSISPLSLTHFLHAQSLWSSSSDVVTPAKFSFVYLLCYTQWFFLDGHHCVIRCTRWVFHLNEVSFSCPLWSLFPLGLLSAGTLSLFEGFNIYVWILVFSQVRTLTSRDSPFSSCVEKYPNAATFYPFLYPPLFAFAFNNFIPFIPFSLVNIIAKMLPRWVYMTSAMIAQSSDICTSKDHFVWNYWWEVLDTQGEFHLCTSFFHKTTF